MLVSVNGRHADFARSSHLHALCEPLLWRWSAAPANPVRCDLRYLAGRDRHYHRSLGLWKNHRADVGRSAAIGAARQHEDFGPGAAWRQPENASPNPREYRFHISVAQPSGMPERSPERGIGSRGGALAPCPGAGKICLHTDGCGFERPARLLTQTVI